MTGLGTYPVDLVTIGVSTIPKPALLPAFYVGVVTITRFWFTFTT